MTFRFALALAALAAACSTPDPLYCDQDTPCDDPELSFCDLEGDYPASEGIDHTCIAEPAFAISLSDDDAQVRIGDQLDLEVTIDRTDDFPGDITITADGLPDGTSADPLTIPDGATTGTLTIQGGDADPGALAAATVTATAGPIERDADLNLLVLGPAGSLDPTFGTLGVAAEPSAITDDALGLGQFSDGSLAVCGATFDSDVGALIGFTGEGQVNAGFADEGVRMFDLGELSLEGRLPYRCAEQSDGKLILAVGTDSGELVVARFASDGVPDPGFAGGGIVVSTVTSIAIGVGAVAIGPDDEIVIGVEAPTGVATMLFVRFSRDGIRDESFAGGRVDLDRGTNPDIGAIQVAADGSVVVAARATDGDSVRIPFVARFTPQGAVDESFANDGALEFDPDLAFDAVVEEDNGDLIVGGTLTVDSAPTYKPVLWRISATGAAVASFGVDGELELDLPGDASGGLADLLPTDQGLVALVKSGVTVFRLDPVTGDLDPSFGDSGVSVLPLAEGFARAAVRRTDRRIVVLADDDSFQFVLARFFE